MKLKISTTNTDALRNALGVILSLRKFCVLRFTPTHLHMISASLNEPQVWCKLSKCLFDVYEVESIRENIIAMEINAEPLYAALKNFEKSNSDGISIRLQKKASEGSGSSSKALATLAIFYNEHISVTSTISHVFRIPIRLLKKESDERIREPSLVNIDLFLTLQRDIVPLFKRIERYKKSDFLNVAGTRNGYLGLTIKEELRTVTISWRDRLPAHNDDQNEENGNSIHHTSQKDPDEPVNVLMKLKDWKIGAKICELSESVTMILGEMEALVLHCNLDDEANCEIVYFIASINQSNNEI